MTEVLDDAAVDRELATRDGWSRSGSSLTRTWQFKGFGGAMQFANVIAWIANQSGHHPDIAVHDYNRVTVTSTTHDVGGITEHDFALIGRIDDRTREF
ncbi:4a-hydroxytetrahydrobiopterin dehydratase [Saccharopolyspora sp. HNM0983]|uniref:Putative pterin-4-alpha-carbinolamine dehydratase n=1 Tax=Saccharopolyspora montiporae TaxID=2781240 RepID=A0A929B7S5_9PSEU|nr:4a-hydroxytetrahydrobiopterin dehydratase [Saccharopolyspora sp. HNM0983]MBE9374819.1 4a-hydroxytetrahydrobiopterin dehydratase [Saccharopolyspora sp. HNM0983]